MRILRFDASPEPSDAEQWLATWRAVEDAPELEIVVTRPLQAWLFVAFTALIREREDRGLTTVPGFEFQVDPATWQVAAGTRRPFSPGSRYSGVESRAHAQLIAAAALGDLDLRRSSAEFVERATVVVAELATNVFDHSQRPRTGSAHAFADTSRHRLQIACADRGIGIAASLRSNPEFQQVDDDARLLELATRRGVTSRPDSRSNMGEGLATLVDFAVELHGELWIASGGSIWLRSESTGSRTTRLRSVAEWRGTWICLDAPLP